MSVNSRILAAVVAAIAASAAFYMLALKPKREEAAELRGKVAEQQKQLDDARRLLATNQEARRNFRAAYSAVVRLGKAVPADDDVRSLVVQLDSAAKRAGVDFRSINLASATAAAPADGTAPATPLPPGATVGPAGFPVMPFTFSFTGSFFRLGDFFQGLERFVTAKNQRADVTGRLLTLDSLKLEPDTTGFPQIRASVGATSYLVSPLEGLTGGATAKGPSGTAPSTGSTTTPAPSGTTPAPSGTTPAPSGTTPAPTTAMSTGAIR